MEKRIETLVNKVNIQLDKIREGGEPDADHWTNLQRRLSNVNYLIAYDRVMDECVSDDDDSAVRTYKRKLYRVILQLAIVYRDRESMQAAYFAYFISKHNVQKHMDVGTALQDVLVEYMKKESLYCRVNAVQALCDLGHAGSVVKAITLLDRQDSLPHEKILTDALQSFAGDQEELVGLLWKNLDKYAVKTQLAILNFIRFQSGNYCEDMFAIMVSTEKDKELRLSAIRYFGRYYYEPALEPLLVFAADKNPLNWEYASTAVAALATYKGEAVREVLMEAVHSANWYVRYNAASSLEAHHLDYTDLIEVLSGSDRYAREMIMYRLDFHRMENQEQEQEETV